MFTVSETSPPIEPEPFTLRGQDHYHPGLGWVRHGPQQGVTLKAVTKGTLEGGCLSGGASGDW